MWGSSSFLANPSLFGASLSTTLNTTAHIAHRYAPTKQRATTRGPTITSAPA
jgi:hypothetical protein